MRSNYYKFIGMMSMVILMTIFNACQKEDDNEEPSTTLSVSPESLDFDASGGTQKLFINSNASWVITDLEDWISPFIVSSEGNDSVAITVEAYDGEENRMQVIAVTADDITKNVIIKQSALSLSVSPSTFEFNSEGGTGEISITSNGNWTVTSSSDWCEPAVESSDGDNTLSFTVGANAIFLERTATITVAASGISHEIQISQQGAETSYDIPPDNTDMRDLSSIEMAQELSIGWNVGNSLDAIGGETAWGNPLISQRLMDSVAAAGFKAVRIPVAWSKFSDSENYIIQDNWKNRVEEVVNYVLNSGMYAIINIHWDNGWIQPTYEAEQTVNERLAIMWTQIATHFRDYDDRLLFAGTNEVMVTNNYNEPTQEFYTVQNGYNQTFVTAVRSTGGRNAHRHLVVQGFNTNIDYTVDYAKMPVDSVDNRLLMEVHYYDPYPFTLDEGATVSQWGEEAEDPSQTAGWGNEAHADAQFNKMKTNFVDKGIGVILGEYGTIIKTDLGEEANEDYAYYRQYYTEYVTQSMVNHGLIPFYWDNGFAGNHGMAIFDRDTGARLFPNLVQAIIGAVEE